MKALGWKMQGIPNSIQSLITARYVILSLLQNRNLKQLREICGAGSHIVHQGSSVCALSGANTLWRGGIGLICIKIFDQ